MELGSEVKFSLAWHYDAKSLPLPANQFLFSAGVPVDGETAGGDVLLTFGHANPPIVLPDENGQPVFVGIEDAVLPVQVVSRLVMSPQRVVQLHALLGDWLTQQFGTGRTEPESPQ